MSFITSSQQPVIDQILDHLRMERSELHANGPPAWVMAKREGQENEHPTDDAYLTDPIYEEPVWS